MDKNFLDHDLDCNLDRNPEDVNITKPITLMFIVQSLLHRYPPNIWIKSIDEDLDQVFTRDKISRSR